MFCQEGKIKEKQIFSKKQLFRDNALQSIQRRQVRLPQTVREHCSPLILCGGSQRQQTRNKVPGDAASAMNGRTPTTGFSSPATSLCKGLRQMQNISSNIFSCSANAILHKRNPAKTNDSFFLISPGQSGF